MKNEDKLSKAVNGLLVLGMADITIEDELSDCECPCCCSTLRLKTESNYDTKTVTCTFYCISCGYEDVTVYENEDI